jgi:hypothetical protein
VIPVASSLTYNDGSWSTPTLLDSPGFYNPVNLILRMGVDGAGNVIALWTSSYDGSTLNVITAVQPVNQSWVFGGDLVLENLYAYEGDVSVTPFGSLVSTYMYFDGTDVDIQSTESDLGGVRTNIWSIPQNVSTGTYNGFPRVTSSLAGQTLNAVTLWVNSAGMGSENAILASTGSRTVVLPPTITSVTQSSNDYYVFTEYYNTVTWTASGSPNIIEYAIYRDGIFITTVPSSSLQYIDDNAVFDLAVTYGVQAVDDEQSVSQIATYPFTP